MFRLLWNNPLYDLSYLEHFNSMTYIIPLNALRWYYWWTGVSYDFIICLIIVYELHNNQDDPILYRLFQGKND